MSNIKHWILEEDQQQILWLGLDRADERVNSFSDEVLDELNSMLQDISKMSHAKGLVIHSLKKKGFIAGADIRTLSKLKNSERALEFIRKGQAVFARLERLSIPTVAIVNGFCLGGGMELVLACDYRIATDEEDTIFGLPEVLLGFHPGWGGTVRLPRLIGGFQALSSLMLSGKTVRAPKAKAMGIVDDVVPLRQLKRAAVYFVQKKPHKHKPRLMESLTNLSVTRSVLAPLLRYMVAKRVRKAHYPAPFALIDLWEKTNLTDDAAYAKEADSVEHLLEQNDTAKNLIRVFMLRESLKSFGKDNSFAAKHVHVIGAGVMGGDIAAWCARQGLSVTLQDQSYERIAPAMGRAYALFKKTLKKPRRIQAAMDRLTPDPKGLGASHADVIIEAVFEDLSVKQDIFKQLESVAKPDAILATNTSSIPLDEINVVLKDAKRLVGIHFFNPVPKMELVEVVRGEQTSAEIVEAACAFVSQIGRLPLPVQSSPGFLVNRVLMPYLLECIELLEEGYQPEAVDEAAKAFGMMMGPVELADTVGLDVCLAVAKNLTSHFGGKVPTRIIDMVDQGKLGRKTNQGFYSYRNGKPVKQKISEMRHQEEITNRLILRMINEASACLRDGVVASADLLDAGMIFATGFAPFRGGPMHYAEQFGQEQMSLLFEKLASQFGDRFKAVERAL